MSETTLSVSFGLTLKETALSEQGGGIVLKKIYFKKNYTVEF